MRNIFPIDWYRIKDKLVIKKGKSFYKDGNKLGRRKTGLVLFEKAGREVRKYNMQYPDMDMQ